MQISIDQDRKGVSIAHDGIRNAFRTVNMILDSIDDIGDEEPNDAFCAQVDAFCEQEGVGASLREQLLP